MKKIFFVMMCVSFFIKSSEAPLPELPPFDVNAYIHNLCNSRQIIVDGIYALRYLGKFKEHTPLAQQLARDYNGSNRELAGLPSDLYSLYFQEMGQRDMFTPWKYFMNLESPVSVTRKQQRDWL